MKFLVDPFTEGLKPRAGENNSLGKRVLEGAIWMSAAQLLARTSGSIRIIVLAAILSQHELGLFGIALIVLQLIERLSDTGMRQALIQSPKEIGDIEKGTAWVSQITRGIGLGTVLFFFAGTAEAFFEKPGVAELLVWLAIVPVIQGLSNIGVVHLNRELRFRKLVLLDLAKALFDLVFSVTFAWFFPIALSLVYGKICGTICTLVITFFIDPRWAKFRFSFHSFRSLYTFGFWIFMSAILSFIMIRGGDLVIGKLLETTDLSIYQVAYSLACIPIMGVMSVFAKTTFPAFSRMQEDQDRLASVFLRVFALTGFTAMLSIAGMVALGSDFTSLCFRPEYASVATLLPVLAVWGSCRAMGAANSVIFQAIGKPALATVFQFLMLGMFIVILIPATKYYGTVGLAISLAVIGVTAQIGRYLVIARVLKVTLKAVLSRALLPVVLASVTWAVTTLVLTLIHEQSHLLRFVTGLCVVLTTYGIGSIWLDHRFQFGLLSFVENRLPRKLLSLTHAIGLSGKSTTSTSGQ